MIFKFTIPGRPAPKGSRVQGFTKDGRSYSREANPAAGVWGKLATKELRTQAIEQHVATIPKSQPVVVHVAFVYEEPKKPKYSYPVGPDTDKLMRNLGDCLERAGVLENDTQIVRWEPVKMFGSQSVTRGWILPA